MKFTTENMDKLIAWQKQGRRSITINIDFEGMCVTPVKIWCYDYDLRHGIQIASTFELPTENQLKEEKTKELKKQIEEMGD